MKFSFNIRTLPYGVDGFIYEDDQFIFSKISKLVQVVQTSRKTSFESSLEHWIKHFSLSLANKRTSQLY